MKSRSTVSGGHAPSKQLLDYHHSVAKGGVGMTTVAYAAVCQSGLSFERQLWMRPEIVPGLKELTDAVHKEGAFPGHILSKAAERIVLFLRVNGPIFTGVNNFDSIIIYQLMLIIY